MFELQSLQGGRDNHADFSALDTLVCYSFFFFSKTEERAHARMFELQSQQGGVTVMHIPALPILPSCSPSRHVVFCF